MAGLITFSVTDQLNEMISSLDGFNPSELNRIIRESLNNSARAAKDEIYQEMLRVFDKPTPYTLNSLWVKYARPEQLYATVEYKDRGDARGTPAKEFLTPEVDAGGRDERKSERILASILGIPHLYLTPSSNAPRDSYGNVTVSTWSSVTNFFKTNGSGIKNNKRNNQYFAILPGVTSHLKPGIYRRAGVNLLMIFHIVSQPHYRVRLKFYEIALKKAREVFVSEFQKAVVRAFYRRQGKLEFASQSSNPIQGPFES